MAASPTAHLTPAEVEAFGREMDAIRDAVIGTRGEADAAYIKRMIKIHRGLEFGGRAAMLVSLFPPAWLAGTAMLSAAKILENMELGHNILHGQWDWMRDPEIHSTSWEWDSVISADGWKHTHNDLHHRWTNVVGKDRDVGYTILRMSEDQEWTKRHLIQPLYNLLLMPVFEWGIALYDLEYDEVAKGRKSVKAMLADLKTMGRKAGKQAAKDYLLWPLLSGPSFIPSVLGNLTANVARNLWSHTIIFCGHFPDGAETFTEEQIEGETRAQWYLRQLQGSANITGGTVFHIMSGNLSHQIEHHLFPDLPSNRYAEISPKVQAVCEKYGLPYTTGRLSKQYASTWKRIFKLSLPPRSTPVKPSTLALAA
jgi:linoleoyl-CoA desaturase